MKLTLVCVLIFAMTAVYAGGESQPFVIKHRSSGLYLYLGSSPVWVGPLLEGCIECSSCTFEQVTDHWGYIKVPFFGFFLMPKGGSLQPSDNTWLSRDDYSKRHWGGLFALDAVNEHIIHKGGSFVHVSTGVNPPVAWETYSVIRSGTNDGMRFKFVSPDDLNKEVLVYGEPTMTGEWKIINMVRNPLAEHTNTYQVNVGKSVTESRTSSFQYGWEVSVGIEYKILSASASASFEAMAEKTSSSTWSTQTTRTRTITIKPGKTVVTWQFLFMIEQNSSKGVYQSDLLADTDSETKVPEDIGYNA